MSGLVGNPEDRFSSDEAQFITSCQSCANKMPHRDRNVGQKSFFTDLEKRPWSALFGSLFKTHLEHLSLVMKKPAFCICENKDADQLRGYREADQRLCLRYLHG